jgi:hypothetical protein
MIAFRSMSPMKRAWMPPWHTLSSAMANSMRW